MQNVELKARLHDWLRAVAACESLGAELQGDLHQIDTYFPVPSGRLKLREITPGEDHLVFYHRPDVAGPKVSDYQRAPAGSGTRALLADALGVECVVEKTRTLWLWDNVRIHLDKVTDLGTFLEFEAVVSEHHSLQRCEEQVAQLRGEFAIADADLLETSYREMMLAHRSSPVSP
jgi:adenylate cyclase class IV